MCACAGQGPGAAPPAGQACVPGLPAVRQEHPLPEPIPPKTSACARLLAPFGREHVRRLARNDCKDQQNSPVLPREAVERQSSAAVTAAKAAVTAANVADHHSRDPLHAPHSGQTPEFASVSQRVSRPLVPAVVLVLRGRGRLATCAAADIEGRSPQVIRRRHYRMPRIVREVVDPFP
jgi:hypothetical protein